MRRSLASRSAVPNSAFAIHYPGYKLSRSQTPVLMLLNESSDHEPMYHNSTPMTSNLVPSSLSGSLPNVGHVADTPFSRLSSSQRP